MATRKKKTSIKTKAKKTVKKEKVLGMVTHYFEKIDVAVIKLSQSLKVGDYIEFRHGDVSFSQIVESMQVNHKNIPAARIGSEIGLKVAQKVKEGFKVYKVEQPKLELEPTKPKVEVNKYSYKPIFPTKRNMDDYRPTLISRPAEPKPEATPAPAPLAQPKPTQAPAPKKSGYGNVKFLKF